MDSLTYLQLLRHNRSFRRLWWGQVISELGNWFNFIAGLGLVRMISHGDATVTTITLLARLMPFTLFAPLAGALADRWSWRWAFCWCAARKISGLPTSAPRCWRFFIPSLKQRRTRPCPTSPASETCWREMR